MVKINGIGFIKSILRDLVPYISKTKKKGVLGIEYLKWCKLSLSTYFDNAPLPGG